MHGEMHLVPERVATMNLHKFAREHHLADFPDEEMDDHLDDVGPMGDEDGDSAKKLREAGRSVQASICHQFFS